MGLGSYELTDARKFCATLGQSKNEIAASLQERGFKGQRRDRIKCPLFSAIKAEIPTFDWRLMLPIFFPGAPGEFLLSFDRGEFPGLEY